MYQIVCFKPFNREKKKTNHNSHRSLNIFPRDSDRDYSHYRRVNKYEVNRVCTRRLARMVEQGPEAFLALFRSALAIILCSIDLVRRVAMVKKERKGKETWQRPGHKEDKTLLVEKKRGAWKRGRRQAFSPPLWDLILVPSIPALLINHYRRRRRRRGCHSARLFSRATSFSCPFLKGE